MLAVRYMMFTLTHPVNMWANISVIKSDYRHCRWSKRLFILFLFEWEGTANVNIKTLHVNWAPN